MSVSLMRGVLDQIHNQIQQVSEQPWKKSVEPQNAPSFSDVLFNSINEINKTQINAKEMTQQWMYGNNDIGLNDVMLAMQKSSISFSFGVQARNKLLSTYQEVMNTPV
ncbi:flagellar hook-basal body complex protein FliE [Citrobacter sp. wls619]|uniref:flagellar hook-basal body complex protein FliE n=1 Tax=Citrobacter sp. wls619 TaxID=2576432 RepID=UPI0010C9A30A|nr:flagellar hook-basal body complex protein FliE [Citrobacter sp. wls619]TKV07851.1 flagellar hook-basal body complex protein FliE [Citrobacter sp. wls619]